MKFGLLLLVWNENHKSFKYFLHDSIQCFRAYSIFFILVLLLPSTSFFLSKYGWFVKHQSIFEFSYITLHKWWQKSEDISSLWKKGIILQRSRRQTEQILHNHAMAEKQKKNLMYINRFLRMPFSQMTFDMISDIYDQFSRSLITFIVLCKWNLY